MQIGKILGFLRPCTTLLQYLAYSYRVWITLIKLLYSPLRYRRSGPDIHHGERLCGRLPRRAQRVSEKNSSRQFGDQRRQCRPSVLWVATKTAAPLKLLAVDSRIVL